MIDEAPATTLTAIQSRSPSDNKDRGDPICIARGLSIIPRVDICLSIVLENNYARRNELSNDRRRDAMTKETIKNFEEDGRAFVFSSAPKIKFF